MSDSIQKLRENFNGQLNQTTTQITNLRSALVNLERQQEQLRGAIFALDTVLQNQNTEAAAAPAPAESAPATDAAPAAAPASGTDTPAQSS